MYNHCMEKYRIKPDMLISDLTELSPEAALFLTTEYGFHCVGCFASQFDSLENGARIHGIIGEDFEAMMSGIQKIIDKELNASSENSEIKAQSKNIETKTKK